MDESYDIINPWNYGKSETENASTLGYRWNQGDEGPGGWETQGMNNEGATSWQRVRADDNGDYSLPSFSGAYDPKEAQRQRDFKSKFIPALQTGRKDIWDAYNSKYGDQAIRQLYLDLGEYGGGGNVYGYDPTNRQPASFLGGPRELFNSAYNDPGHFQVVGGPGYLPYSWDEVAADPVAKLASLGLFLDDQGNPLIGGVRSTPNNNRKFIANLAEKLPIALGGAVLTGGLLGGFDSLIAGGAEGLTIGGSAVDYGLGSGYLGNGSIGLNLPGGAGALGGGLDFGATLAGAGAGIGGGIGGGLSLGGAETLGSGLDFASSLADPVGSMAIEGGANIGPSMIENATQYTSGYDLPMGDYAARAAEMPIETSSYTSGYDLPMGDMNNPATMGVEQSGAVNQTPISLEDFSANINADMPIGASEKLITDAGLQMPPSSLIQKAVDAGIPFDLATKLVGKGINVNDLLSGIQRLYTSGKQKESADQLMRTIQQAMGAQDPFASGRTNATNAYNSYLTDPTKWANEFAPLLDEVARRARRTNAQQGRNFYIGDNGLPRGSGGGAVDFFNQMAPAFYGLQQKKLSDLAQQATQNVPNYAAYMSALGNATGMQNSANSAWAGALPFIWNGLGGADTFKSAWDTVGNWFGS